MLKKNAVRFSLYGFLALVCAFPSIFLVIYHGYDIKNALVVLALSLSFIAILISLGGVSPRASVISLAIFALITPFEIWMISFYENTIDSNYLGIVSESNQSESIDFVLHLLPAWVLIFILIVIIVALLALLYPWKLKKKGAQLTFLIGAVVFSGFLFTYQNFAAQQKKVNYQQSRFSFLSNDTDEELLIRQSYPAGLLFSLKDFYFQRQELKQVVDLHKDYRFGAQMLTPPPKRQVYILVIGESSSYYHWGINGYKRQTTPLLAQRNDLINFQDMYTIETTTRMAVPLILSRKPYTSADPVFEEASILTYFKELGFHTTWVSLQAQYGFHDSPISVTAFEADDVIFLNPVSYRFGGKYDYEALPVIKETIEKTDGNLFIVVHTLGSHVDFADRYDESMRIFTPDREHQKRGGLWTFEYSPAFVNAYDNSIVATDYFLANLVTMLEGMDQHDSWMFYLSDHGEALYDDCTQKLGHGFVAPAVNHIPAVFWASKGYQENYPQKIDALQINANKEVSSTMMFNTMVGLSGGEIPGETRLGYDLSQKSIVVPDDRAFAKEHELFTHFCKK